MAEAQTLTTELALLSLAREGDQEAGRRLMATYGPSMLRTAWNVLGRYGGSEADDVVQEAFIAALTTKALPNRDLGAWMRAVTARKAVDSVRRLARRGEEPLAYVDADAAGLRSGRPREPEAWLDVLSVREGLRRLSPADRAVLTLVDLEGWPMGEAAAALGMTYVAVRLRAVRARRKLARLVVSGVEAGGAAAAGAPGSTERKR